MDTDDARGEVDTPESPTDAPKVPLATPEAEEPMVLDVSGVCSRCRCAWLCCDCHLGCCVCKQRRLYCYCRWSVIPNTRCEFCIHWIPQCRCRLKFRCKWCQVTMRQCRWGGCLRFLPSRHSPEGKQYIDLFMVDDGPEAELLAPVVIDNESIKSFDTLASGANVPNMPSLPRVREESLPSSSSTVESWLAQCDNSQMTDVESDTGFSSRLSASTFSINHQ